VLFEMPGVDEREKIWRVQMHPTLTPLAPDVNFRALAESYEASGGDIRNAVLKAAMAAASEGGQDAFKVIHHRHLDEGMREVLAAKRVMQQSLFTPAPEAVTPIQKSAIEMLGTLHTGSWVALGLSVLAVMLAAIALVVTLMR
jgi:hypothetical protein